MHVPIVIIVTGHPATGKTTLAHALARALQLPLFTKDLIKESLFETLGWSDRAWSRRVGVAAIELLYQLLEVELAAGRSCIIESNFHPEFATARLQALMAHAPFVPIQVRCSATGEVLLARFRARAAAGERHPGHSDSTLDDELAPLLLAGPLAALAIGGSLIEVDTTDLAALDLAGLVAQLDTHIKGHTASQTSARPPD